MSETNSKDDWRVESREDGVARFNSMDDDIKIQALEYYTLMKLQAERKTQEGDIQRAFDLMDIICDNNITGDMVGIEY